MFTICLVQYVVFVVNVWYYNWSYHDPETRRSWLGCDYCVTFSFVCKFLQHSHNIWSPWNSVSTNRHPHPHPFPGADVYQTTQKASKLN